ncbi:hypothetical protein [Streptomyces collinus]|uniref:hypothetical protein n=1 Tax=Streptomyces collinus TaxID=42684 RepID=UPI003F5408CB
MTDRDAACGMLERLRVRYRTIRLVWAVGGYTGRLVDWSKGTLRLRDIAAGGPTGGIVADEELMARYRLELPFGFVPSSPA